MRAGLNSELEKKIREQVVKFYPELSNNTFKIQMIAPIQRLHKSRIYTIRTIGDKGFSKDLIVKQRIYNPDYKNDISRDTLREFESLCSLEKKNQGRYRVVKALGMIPEDGLLLMERVSGERFSDLLKFIVKHGASEQKIIQLKKYFFRSGQWLKAFHDSTAEGRIGQIPVDEDIFKAEKIIKNLSWATKVACLKQALNQMKTLKYEASLEKSPIVFKHGDFQLRNIMFESGEPIIIDVGGGRSAIALQDICDFLIGFFNFNILFVFSHFTDSMQVDCASSFLDGYFIDQRKPKAAIKFLLMLCAIQQFESIVSRNRKSLLKVVWASWYYSVLIKRLEKWSVGS